MQASAQEASLLHGDCAVPREMQLGSEAFRQKSPSDGGRCWCGALWSSTAVNHRLVSDVSVGVGHQPKPVSCSLFTEPQKFLDYQLLPLVVSSLVSQLSVKTSKLHTVHIVC